MLNSRERVETALNFEQPDRPPVFATFVPEVESRLRSQFGISDYDLGAALGNDMVKATAGLEMSFYGGPEPEYVCPWGIRWRWVANRFGKFTEIVSPPLAGSTDKLSSYQIPDPNDDSHYESFRQIKKLYGDSKWLIGSCQVSIFEASWYLRGLDQLMMDMITEPDYVHALMDKVMQFPLTAGRKYAEMGADMVWFGDDVAMQTGMMLSISMWREFLKPRYAQLFAEVKRINPRVKIAYHSCGNCEPILDDMVDIGLDVINPIQPLAMDPYLIKKRYGRRLVLFGGVDVQRLLPMGSAQEVREEVSRLAEICGAGGGYILAPAHHIQADTHTRNIIAFYEAALASPVFEAESRDEIEVEA